MRAFPGKITRMGIKSFFPILGAFFSSLLAQENPDLSAAFCAKAFQAYAQSGSIGRKLLVFYGRIFTCRKCQEEWCGSYSFGLGQWSGNRSLGSVSSQWHTFLPFTGRAGDIYPQDGLLAEKSADALFIRTNNAAKMCVGCKILSGRPTRQAEA